MANELPEHNFLELKKTIIVISSADKGLEVDQHNEDDEHDTVPEGCTKSRFSTLIDRQHNLPLS
ncbi:hypothetical protein BCON_0009g00110 [Botryotinia convoluta]|uniref:Uncharacterized protein n=1 Tax=Botryotinia convoluta TaxID=54673 RepID=A0A4Z1IWR7_9HELO|nr:hypothetical protein BCON_0009g00110 [Botryotinia convoluta]